MKDEKDIATPATCGTGGCCAMTRRRGTLRHCNQLAIVTRGGLDYCYYHDPADPKKFGEGYLHAEREAVREEQGAKGGGK